MPTGNLGGERRCAEHGKVGLRIRSDEVGRHHKAAKGVAHQDDRHAEFAALGEQVGNIIGVLREVNHERSSSRSLAEAALIEGQHVEAGIGQCVADMFVPARVFADAVDEQNSSLGAGYCPVSAALREPIAGGSKAGRRCSHGR